MRSALFKWCLGAAICWIAACVPPNGSWQSQPGHQYQAPAAGYDDGNTRDDACFNAFSNCNSLMTVTSNFNDASERGTQVVSECTVTECNEWH